MNCTTRRRAHAPGVPMVWAGVEVGAAHRAEAATVLAAQHLPGSASAITSRTQRSRSSDPRRHVALVRLGGAFGLAVTHVLDGGASTRHAASPRQRWHGPVTAASTSP